ncbi:MAG: hypothetical protein DRO94_00550 [Candidatus Altiarchaeales archaeon]|nr:MAG: hypothetical protein DRO95_03265 [Candidatus Altiarchaeales archaeon]RLI95406.1 MAG: hypothetical protein DRO94_00550 [Candidatus Altiarchaeales archaeon]HDO82033.1 hypothetical protein [Candidatus Altiarchaeales archaeon]HEX54682.1 hypothetical protein [Candidatus Altiarchaeales archaeon]
MTEIINIIMLNPLGSMGLLFFFGVIIASLRGWIPQDVLPVQSALMLTTLLLAILAVLFGKPINIKDITSNIFLHPITALIGGFLVAGALEAAGAFRAAIDILERTSRTPLGLPGTVAILVNMPTIFAMPCGRILAAALIPAAILFGHILAQRRKSSILASVVVFGFIVNAAASCGPSPLGGIGMVGEGMAGSLKIPGIGLGSFSNAQSIAIMLITGVTMLSISFVYRILPDESLVKAEGEAEEKVEKMEKIHISAYLSLFVFFITIAAVFILQPPIPIQTILVILVIVIMVMGDVTIQDLIGGVILHPIMAMISGFIIAGALLSIGSFDVLISLLEFLAETPLGYVGVAVLMANIPTILPMPCGRIIGMALMPGIFLLGITMANSGTFSQEVIPILLVSFIINAAASCGPSPLGGIGGIGEGNLGTEIGVSGKPQQVGIMIGTGIAALIIGVLGPI